MFDNLAEKLQTAFAKLRGNQKLTEADIDEAMRIVRTALLEADVNFRVVKSFVSRVKEQALGADVLDGLQPGQQVIYLLFCYLFLCLYDHYPIVLKLKDH